MRIIRWLTLPLVINAYLFIFPAIVGTFTAEPPDASYSVPASDAATKPAPGLTVQGNRW